MDMDALNKQSEHWVRSYSETKDMFGQNPSYSAQEAARIFKQNKFSKILEIGCGQGRDTLYFAQNGFQIRALDYCHEGLARILERAEMLGLKELVQPTEHDIRNRLPFENETFDACYSHMFFCMAITCTEIENIFNEVRRVLKPGGLNVYTVRHFGDTQYKTGIHHGENMYEIAGGFIVHFFDEGMVKLFAKGYELLNITCFQEGSLPKELFLVTLRKSLTPK